MQAYYGICVILCIVSSVTCLCYTLFLCYFQIRDYIEQLAAMNPELYVAKTTTPLPVLRLEMMQKHS